MKSIKDSYWDGVEAISWALPGNEWPSDSSPAEVACDN